MLVLADPAAASDAVAIAGIVGTLLGSVITGLLGLITRRQQRAHEDLTRFHETRLSAYTEFSGACNKAVAGARMGISLRTEDFEGLHRSFETIRLIASPRVFFVATKVHGTTISLMRTPTPTDADAKYMSWNLEMATFGNAVRDEMGIGSLASRPSPWSRLLKRASARLNKRSSASGAD